MAYYTFADAVEHARNWLGATPLGEQDVSDCKRAAIAALRELSEAHTWTCYIQIGRLNLNAPYSTGTIQFQAAGGSSPLLISLTGGTWPSWAAGGSLRIGEVLYPIQERLSTTTLTLRPEAAPGSDLPAGTAYQLIQDTYLLPEDWRQGDEAYSSLGYLRGLHFVHPRYYLRETASWGDTGTPDRYTISTDPRYPGRFVAIVFPAPDTARTVDMLYRRSPRSLRYHSVKGGTIALSQGSAGITGSGTAFKAGHVGSILRVSEDTNTPTAEWGLNPFVHESRIESVASATALTTRETSPQTLARQGYEISDPVDIQPASMLTAYQRAIEWQMSLLRSMTDKPNPLAAWNRALAEAKDKDDAYKGPRAVQQPIGEGSRFYENLYYGRIDYGS